MTDVESLVLSVLTKHISEINSQSVLKMSATRAKVDPKNLQPKEEWRLLSKLAAAMRLFIPSPSARESSLAELQHVLISNFEMNAIKSLLKSVKIVDEKDIIVARNLLRDLCKQLGFHEADSARCLTAVSELARNIHQYARSGEIEISMHLSPQPCIEIVARDQGPGIADLDSILNGSYRSKTGLGAGLLGTKRLMDEFSIETRPDRGTTVKVKKCF